MVASPVLRRTVAATAFGVATGVMAVAFLVAASTHLGARVPSAAGSWPNRASSPRPSSKG